MEKWFYFFRSPLEEQDSNTQRLIYHSFYKFVYRDIYFMVNEHSLTEDIIQDAFMKAVDKGPLMKSDVNIPAWIRQLTRNTARDYLRKIKRDRQIVEESYVNINDIVSDAAKVAHEVESRVRDELLYQAIDEIKSDYRTVLLLFYIKGKSYREICQVLGITEPVLTQRMVRARKKLLQHFTRKWIDESE